MKVIDFLIKNYPDFEPYVAPHSLQWEDRLIADFKYLNIERPQQTYRRYGYGAANFVAQKFMYDFFSFHGVEKNQFDLYRARLFNSGMSAILTVFEMLNLNNSDVIFHHENLYFCTLQYLQMLGARGVMLKPIDITNCEELHRKIETSNAYHKVVLTETITNHPIMVSAPIKQLSDTLSNNKVYLVIDNTVLGSPLFDAHCIVRSKANFFYIESLTKYYHTDDSAKITAGISIFPYQYTNLIDNTISVLGTYFQLNDLLSMPFNLFEVGESKIEKISDKCLNFYDFIIHQKKTRGLDIYVSNPHASSGTCVSEERCVGIIFLKFKPTNKYSARDLVEKLLQAISLEERASFGHKNTSILPIGLRRKGIEEGLIRIAFGSDDSLEAFINAFQNFIDRYLV